MIYGVFYCLSKSGVFRNFLQVFRNLLRLRRRFRVVGVLPFVLMDVCKVGVLCSTMQLAACQSEWG